jgi:hypothetical protein
MLVFVMLAAGITCVAAVFEFEGLRIATGAVDLGALGAGGSSAMVLLMVDVQHYSLLAAQIFFGLWLAPLGYLAYRSGWFPKALGVVLIAAAASYIVDLLAAFLAPDIARSIHGFATILPAIAEPAMVLYLLVIGVWIRKPRAERVLAAA